MTVFNKINLQGTVGGAVFSSQPLMNDGPFVPVELSVPTALANALTAAGHALPPPVIGVALIDTGASKSCISDTAVNQLNLLPINMVTILTANGPALQGTYPARFTFVTINNTSIEFSSVFGVNLAGQVIQNMPVVALIGRDVLTQCLFVYNGPVSVYSLAL